MKNVETKSIVLELKDFDKGKRQAVIAHAAYNNIDRTEDISRKGMFDKSWAESFSDLAFYLNHKSDLTPGKPIKTWDDDEKAYTQVYLGTHTLGEDVLKMMDEGIIKKASFGYIPIKKDFIEVKGRRVRELKEVKHVETSVLTVLQANPLASVVSVTKSAEFENDLLELKSSLALLEKFCRNTTATDDCIKEIIKEVLQAKHILSKYDTAFTEADHSLQPDASTEEKAKTIKHFINSLN